MAFIPTADTAEVEIRQMLFGQLIENTLYFFLTGGWDETSLLNLAEAVAAWFVLDILPQLSSELTLREVVARDISSATGSQAIDASLAGSAGAAPEGSVPSNVAVAVSFRTAISGRSFRGRNFISGFTANNVTENQIASTVGDSLVAAYNDLPTQVTAVIADAVWVVVSRFTGGAPRLAGEITPITTVTLTDYFIDSMRRRLTGRGT